MKKLLGFVFVLSTFTFTACGDDDPIVDCTPTNFSTEVNNAIDNLNAAIDVFNNENTVENCNAARTAANNYLATVQSFDECTEIAPEDYIAALEGAQNAVTTINC